MHTRFLSFEEYQKMGLKCGLEVHQQLKTRHKLFCRCPNTTYSNRYDAEILRHMRPTLSEMGEYDRTALMEFRTRKEIIYRLHRDTVCTYEMDDAPPFGLNQEALDIAIEIALLFHCSVVGEIHIARKQYLDGSIPTGFQRTMIVGLNGWFPLDGRRIGVRQISLEEDACREVSDVGHVRTYLTDRLCIPLIEVVTEPDFRTPDEIWRGDEVIRRVTRATGKVRRGPGSGRQDTNVSVSGGTRIEIKGVPRGLYIPHLVHWEAVRQSRLLELKQALRHRSLAGADFVNDFVDVTPYVHFTNYRPVRDAIDAGGVVRAVRLPRLRGILNASLGGARVFADELKDRVRVVACLSGKPNLVHSDDLEPTLAPRLWQRVLSAAKATEQDVVVVTWGPARDVITALEEVVARCKAAVEVGVPPETRQVLEDGTNGFERDLPGPNRMYPDTDMPPAAVTSERLARITAGLPLPPWEKHALLKQFGLAEDSIDALLLDGNADVFLKAVRELGVSPAFAAHMLTNAFRRLQRCWQSPERIPQATWLAFFCAFRDGRFTHEVAYRVLERLAREPSAGVDAALEGLGKDPSLADQARLSAEVARVLEPQRALLASRPPDKAERIAMGLITRALFGRADGARMNQVAREWLARAQEVQA
jgi:glutamyl-tRNA(Gln) amidotransferase subunit E